MSDSLEVRFWRSILLVNIFIVLAVFAVDSYYTLLGIDKNADSLQIRKAFKKLALEFHPDKNQDDAELHEKFLKINQAYDTLKDEESRRKYDLFGEEDNTRQHDWKQNYQSWDYYQQNFGIYDDDQEIFTLSRSDFERYVTNGHHFWFINFYSAMCSHCHHLAPVWRKIARELSGVIRFGAVNCEEEWGLCRQLYINSYPSLVLYPNGEKYLGKRSENELMDYVLRTIPTKLIIVNHEFELQEYLENSEHSLFSWLFFICDVTDDEDGRCPSKLTRLRVAAMLDGLVNVVEVNANVSPKIGKDLFDNDKSLIFFPATKVSKLFAQVISAYDAQEISKLVLESLPDVAEIPHDTPLLSLDSLCADKNSSLGIIFVADLKTTDDDNLELKKLPFLLPEVNITKLDCSSHRPICDKYFVHKYPSFAVFKSGERHEFYHDRWSAVDIALFVKDSILSSVETLIPHIFSRRIIESGEVWLVDFYAPWCPPCLQLLPEWRKTSRSFDKSIQFGTVDCTIHQDLCAQYNVHSYPTVVFFNQSVPIHYTGQMTSDEIIEFIQDRLSPSVITLDFPTFEELVADKSVDALWAVDFYSPWCGPCQQISPQWRKLAKMFAQTSNVHVGQVDCTVETDICHNERIRSYPTLRVYPIGFAGTNTFQDYGNWNRDAISLRTWINQFLPGGVAELDNNDFYNRVVYGDEPWIVDFYAPWCGPCHTFAPEFEIIATILSGKVKAGKVNCERTRHVCHAAGIRAYPTVKFYHGTEDPDHEQSILGETIERNDREFILDYVESWLSQTRDVNNHDEL